MPQTRRLRLAALNVKTHPHSPARYEELFRLAKQRRIAVPYHGTRYAMIASFLTRRRTTVRWRDVVLGDH